MLCAENSKPRPVLQGLEEKLTTLEDYTRRENLRFLNIPEEEEDENCVDIIYDIIENELKINTEDIRFTPYMASENQLPKTVTTLLLLARHPIIARFVLREHVDQVLSVKVKVLQL